jgi:hypothetical protein
MPGTVMVAGHIFGDLSEDCQMQLVINTLHLSVLFLDLACE